MKNKQLCWDCFRSENRPQNDKISKAVELEPNNDGYTPLWWTAFQDILTSSSGGLRQEGRWISVNWGGRDRCHLGGKEERKDRSGHPAGEIQGESRGNQE